MSANSNKIIDEPFVSVLTPVYNQEKFIEECILSVLNQTYRNWEYVIVNNCSTDRTLEIVEHYAKKDPRIRLHNNREHLPVMKNLNHAFRQISPKSKYCKVIHGDDLLFPECISRMVELAEANPDVGIVNSYYIEGNTVGPQGMFFPGKVYDGRAISQDFLKGNSNFFGAPSNLLLRSSLIRERTDGVYDESYLQSDLTACLDMLRESDFGFVHQVLTYTRRHEDCLTNTISTKNFQYMLGYFKMHLDYAPVFLPEETCKQVLKKREEIFYIQFARNMLLSSMTEAYKRHSEELRSIGFSVRQGKLLKCLLREGIRHFLRKMGVEISGIRTEQHPRRTILAEPETNREKKILNEDVQAF